MNKTMTREEQRQRYSEWISKMAADLDSPDANGPRVALYLRMSEFSANQTVVIELMTCEFQVYARKRGWVVKSTYVDKEREHTALNRLLGDCQSGGFDIVVTKFTKRFSDDINEVLEITRKFEEQSVEVYFYGEDAWGSKEIARRYLEGIWPTSHYAFPYLDSSTALPVISQQEFCDHIDDEDFFLVYGNPVIIKAESGTKLLAIAFSLYERYMRILGRGDEIDVIKKECADAYKREK